jgi:DNA-binding LacI/PurR family transcriptional regulator
MFALEYLHGKGHRSIGYCIGRRTGTNSRFREAAFKDFHVNHHIPYEPAYIFADCLFFEDGEKVIERMGQMPNPPSALLVTNDDVAAGIILSAQKRSLSVPDNLAIIGFNNQPIAKMMNISTIEIPLVEIGRKLFHQGINDRSEIIHQEIPVTLIERKTV